MTEHERSHLEIVAYFKDVKGLLGGIHVILLIIMGVLLYPYIGWWTASVIIAVIFVTLVLHVKG